MSRDASHRSPVREKLGNHRLIWAAFVIACLLLSGISIALAQERERAQRIHDRIAGVPPSEATLDEMADMISNSNAIGAARLATEDRHFYTVTLKNFAAPWTNRDQSAFVPLNDYITLVIGLVLEDRSFDRILYGDMLYTGRNITPAPSADSNAHFEALEEAMHDPGFDPESELAPTTQSGTYPLPADATAGAMTTRGAAEAFFVAGTNRAMLRFTLMNHLCTDLEQLHDTSLPPDRIRQDVSRSPGGDSRVFVNNCIGCHAGMDPLAQAFAYYNFDEVSGSIEYTEGDVQPKYFNNDQTFEDGFITPDDSWDNYWREGRNSTLGWSGAAPQGSGEGAKSLGRELAGSRAFAECQVRKVFRTVCLREPEDADDRQEVESMANAFETDYNLRNVFAQSAVHCSGN